MRGGIVMNNLLEYSSPVLLSVDWLDDPDNPQDPSGDDHSDHPSWGQAGGNT